MKVSELKEKFSKILADDLGIDYYDKFIPNYLDKITNGGEIEDLKNEFHSWREKRLLPNLVELTKDDYLLASISALKTYGNIAGTDYGSSRQRDKMQMWSDMTRGYLGEIAVQKKIENDFNISTKLEHDKGDIKDFLASDLPKIKKRGEDFRDNKIKVSIKTTKWNGIWLDCPGNQYSHSDVFVLVKVNTGTEHLMSFLKESNFFKDNLLVEGIKKNVITEKQKDEILNKISDFKDIGLFAYIAGFHIRSDDTTMKYKGKKGRKNFKIISAKGYLDDNFENKVRKENNLPLDSKIEFVQIGEFTSTNKFIINVGNLSYKQEDWKDLIEKF